MEVLRCIVVNPGITANGIAMQSGLKERQVRNHITVLKKSGIIKRVGSNKTGHWEVAD